MRYSAREIEEALDLSHKIVHDAPATRMQAIATLRKKKLLVNVGACARAAKLASGKHEERKKGIFYIRAT